MTTLRLPGTLAEVQHSPEGAHVGAFFDLDGTLVAGYTAAALATARRKEGDYSFGDAIRSLRPLLAFARGTSVVVAVTRLLHDFGLTHLWGLSS